MKSIETTVTLAPHEAEALVRTALAEHGFGVLTEIDVAAVFKAKLGVERPFLKILGACNPGYAQRALALDASVSLLLPCNVTVETTENGTRVAAVDPLELMHDPAFRELATEVSDKLQRTIDAVAASGR